ncbi:regulator of chromosome condensation 1/beta-lactamase-inhibitor protein II [Fennellomyces sp. T-0311]|nr:regulator of chromosome condensation 1/beta-lactamase-inhibitor protein II [Fennellomyces sp. T-0311]
MLYAFGSNGSGQLGVGHTDDINVPEQCLGIPDTDALSKVVGGGNHAVALTKNGQIYVTGDNESKFHQPTWAGDRCWRDVACGWSFTLLVSEEGKVYGMGTARSGELGSFHGSTQDLVSIDIGDAKIMAVACGWRHAVALDENGKVYGWGWNRKCQLGEGESSAKKPYTQLPLPIHVSQPIVQVACGHTYTLLRAQDGSLLGFGSNKYHQLDAIDIRDAACMSTGWHHAAALGQHGQLQSWGRNDHGQTTAFHQKVDRFVCGSEHMLVVHAGKVFAWGWNEHGNCTSNKESVLEPLEVSGLPDGRITLVGAGCATSWIAIDPFIEK